MCACTVYAGKNRQNVYYYYAVDNLATSTCAWQLYCTCTCMFKYTYDISLFLSLPLPLPLSSPPLPPSLFLFPPPPSLFLSPQPTSPYPLTVTRQSFTGSSSIYTISLVDTKSPPQQNFTNTLVSLSSTLTNQKQIIRVSYTGITDPVDIIQCPSTDDESKPVKIGFLNEEQWNLLFVVVACLILLLATIVVILALRQSSQRPNDGFGSKLPPTNQPQSPALSQNTPTPNHSQTPLWSNSGNQSAFQRTGGRVSHQTPTRTSPQHNLFSQ